MYRFITLIQEQAENKLVLREQGYGLHSAKAIGRIMRESVKITTLDLTMNNITLGV